MYEELVKRLKHTASLYFALPTDGGDLSLTRMLSEAADAIEELGREYESVAASLTESVELVRKLQSPRWIPVTERLPESGVHVLLACKTLGGNKYVCDGFHTEKFSQPTEFYENIDADYSEETDEYYFPEGWWEVIKNWDDYSCVAIEDTVTHWMPLPQPPKEET